MLESYEDGLVIEERVYPNLVRVFYSNIVLSDTRENRFEITIRRVLIEFNVRDLNSMLGTENVDS